MSSTLEEFFTPKQIAIKFGVTPKTVYHWLKTGTLKSRKIGGIRRISSIHVHQMMYPEAVGPNKPAHECRPPIIGNNRSGYTYMCEYCNTPWMVTMDDHGKLYWAEM
jgi:excisionase family DNA binding protein